MAKFIYFLANSSTSLLLKEELKRKHPKFNLAFSKGHFMTFKRSDQKESGLDFNPECIFARAFGLSLGKGKISEIGNILFNELKNNLRESFLLHEWSLIEGPAWSIRKELSSLINLKTELKAKRDDLIIDVIQTTPNEFFLGLRKCTFWQTPFCGGTPDFSIPQEAPSRAWLKTQEAIELTNPHFEEGDNVLEIGSAPGGSVYNFLSRGLSVYGVDTGEMSPLCLDHPRYNHFPLTMQKISNHEISKIKSGVHWLAIDINQKPSYTLRELRRLIPLLTSLKGIFLTLKLTDNEVIKKLDSNILEIKKYGLNVFGTQLFHNRNEAFIYASKK